MRSKDVYMPYELLLLLFQLMLQKEKSTKVLQACNFFILLGCQETQNQEKQSEKE